MNNAQSAIGKALRDKLDGDMLRGLSKEQIVATVYGGRPTPKIEGDKFAPIKVVESTVTTKVPETTVTREVVRVEHTKWFDFSKFEPGQPGIFEVDRPHIYDGEQQAPRRFAYWLGRRFGPISVNPDMAYRARFHPSALSESIKAFRGLKEGE
jgi:hypothetical protein